MRSVGTDSNTVEWVINWLSSRKQRVVLRRISSYWQPVTSGVPQGSVLEPLLLFIYINDIDDGMKGQIINFADDTKLYTGIRSEQDTEALQKDRLNRTVV